MKARTDKNPAGVSIARPLAPLVESPPSVYVVGVGLGIACAAALMLLLGALAL